MTESILTPEQQQRMEALNAGAALLVDRSVSPSSLFTKGSDSVMKASAMDAEDTPQAITLAEYIVSGIEAPMSDEERLVSALHVGFDEDGTTVTLAQDGETA